MSFHSYGSTDILRCPLCNKQALAKTKTGITVCKDHTSFEFPTMKCLCGEHLQVRDGKFGAFCLCSRCGTINLRKAFEANNISLIQFNTQKREIIVDATNAHLFGLRELN
ncbi:MAG TPA: hypothetical protein VFE88_04865 [Candidatus Nanoarchaeia archaeon]|nr:hypothetical protein [Candidatus Nanoarchaeia archaeon]